MKAIARLVWTYLTAFPILRWVGVVALGSLPFAVLGIWPRTRGWLTLPIIAFAIHSLSMAIATPYLFRVVSSPRSHRFLPHFRGRSLAAFLVIVAVVSAPWIVGLLVASPASRPPYAAFVLPFLIILPLLIMLLMVFTFFPVGVVVTFALFLAIAWAMPRLGGPPELVFVAGPMAIAIFVLGAWVGCIAFSIWYLRARRIEPFQSVTMILERIGIRDSAGAVDFDRGSAMAASLAAAYPHSSKHMLFWVAMLVLGMKLVGVPLSGVRLLVHTAPALIFPALIIPSTLLAAVAPRFARRTRSLWLKSGLSRRGLLAAIEKQIWRSAVPGALVVSVVLSSGIALAYDVPMPMLARGLASAAATAVLAVYLSVAFVRDSTFIEACIAAVLVASAGVGAWAALSAPTHIGVWLATILTQVALALVFRAVAITQWRRIDWLMFKPPRFPSQSWRRT